MASIEDKTDAKEVQESEEMTFSKTCQIEYFAMPTIIKCLAFEGISLGLEPVSQPEVPVELVGGCVCKAKHSLIAMAPEMSNRRRDTRSIFRFKRNRL